MKEIIEIRLEDTEGIDGVQLLNSQHVFFDIPDRSSKPFGLVGRVISYENGVLKLDSQLYYERNISPEIKAGALINFYDNFKKEKIIARGEIISRYFRPAEKNDWKIEKEIDDNNSDSVTINYPLSSKEKQMLELGVNPLSMDDKWFSFVADNTIHYYRSWTGIEFFRAKIVELNSESNKWQINTVKITRDSTMSLTEMKDLFCDLLKYGIKRKLRVMDELK